MLHLSKAIHCLSTVANSQVQCNLQAPYTVCSAGTGDDSFLADRRLVITTIGLLLILPMCFPRDLGALAWVSMAAVRAGLLVLHICLSAQWGQTVAVLATHACARQHFCV